MCIQGHDLLLRMIQNLDDDDEEDHESPLNDLLFLLERLLSEQRTVKGDVLDSKDIELVNEIVRNWAAQWKQRDAHHRGSSLFNPVQMLGYLDSLASQHGLRPNTETYRYLIDASLSRRFPKEHSAADFCEKVFERMLQSSLQADHSPTLFDFHKVMTVLARERRLESIESYMHELERMSENDATMEPTIETYTILLSAFASRKCPHEATRLLEKMVKRGLLVDRTHFMICMSCWVDSGLAVAGERNEYLLLRMQELSETHDTKPCIKCIVKVIQAWIEARRDISVERAEAILQLIPETDFESKSAAEAFLWVIKGHAMSGQKAAPDKCHGLFRQLVELVPLDEVPHGILQKLYSFRIMAWSRSNRKDAAERAQAIFDGAKLECKEAKVDFQPDRFCYSSLLEAWARVDAERCESVWKEMCESYQKGNESCKPNTKAFNSLLLSWSRSKDPKSAARTRDLFAQMSKLGLEPDVISYNAVLTTFGGSDDFATARRGQVLFDRLKERFSKGDRSCRPTTVSYTKAIQLWTCIKSPEALERAQNLLTEMQDRQLQPDEQTYKAFLKVLHNSDHPDKKERTLAILRRMNR